MEAKFASDRRVGWMRYARMERGNSDEGLVALVSVERRTQCFGLSLHRDPQPDRFFHAGGFGCGKCDLETRHLCR